MASNRAEYRSDASPRREQAARTRTWLCGSVKSHTIMDAPAANKYSRSFGWYFSPPLIAEKPTACSNSTAGEPPPSPSTPMICSELSPCSWSQRHPARKQRREKKRTVTRSYAASDLYVIVTQWLSSPSVLCLGSLGGLVAMWGGGDRGRPTRFRKVRATGPG